MTILRMAASYREACGMIRLRISALRAAQAEADARERARLEQRIRDLSAMYRDAREIACVLERYYDRRYTKNEQYPR